MIKVSSPQSRFREKIRRRRRRRRRAYIYTYILYKSQVQRRAIAQNFLVAAAAAAAVVHLLPRLERHIKSKLGKMGMSIRRFTGAGGGATRTDALFRENHVK